MAAPTPRRARGKIVVLCLLGLCVLGCLGTVWRYGGIHQTTTVAEVRKSGETIEVVGTFADPDQLAPGQRATFTVDGRPGERFRGFVKAREADDRWVIAPEAPDSVPPSGKAAVTVDTSR